MKEIISLRKPREKHYLNDDGTITLYAYDYDVHYLKGGTFEEIKNNLIEKEDCIQNEANSLKIKFLKNHPHQILKVMEEENYLEYSLLNKNIETELWHDQNSVIFFDVLKNIDLQYTIQNNKLKDYITLKDKSAKLENLVFQINSNLELVLNNENIELKKNNKTIYLIEKPTLMDKDKNYYPIHYKLEKQEENYYLSFIVEKEILEKEELYPLVIDPIIMNNRGDTSFETWISSLYPDKELGDMEFAKIGVDENSINRALLKFPLPKMNSSFNIVNATVFLSNWVSQEELNKNRQIINVHEVTTEWDEYLATWNQMHDKYKKKVSSFFYPVFNQSSNNVTYTSFDLTKLVKEWYGGKQNNGILLKLNNETYNENIFPYIFNTTEYDLDHKTTYRPYLLITYKIQSGLVPYMNYNEVGHKNGTSYINTFNGNVVSIFDIIDTISKKLPIGLQAIYNSCEYSKVENCDFGAGWKLNYDQEIIEETIDNEKYLKYITDSNAIHYFYWNEELNLYKDEDGLNATIKQEENKYILTLKDGYQYHFEKINDRYKLTKIIDNANNQCTIEYDDENKITSIIDGEGQIVNITYKNVPSELLDKFFKTVQFETSGKESNLRILGTKLQFITNKFGTTNFVYENDKIVSIYDNIIGMKKSFAYDNNSGRVTKVTEYGKNNLEGKSFHYSYGANLTKVTDNLGKSNILLFNESGKLVNKYTKTNENAPLKDIYGYSKEFFNDLNIKEIKNSTIPQKHIENLLINSSFENNTEYNFSFTNAIVINENAKIGLHCLKLDSSKTSSISYTIPQNNKYTISFDFKYEGLEDVIFNLYSLNENQKIKKCSNSFSEYKNNFEYSRVSFDGEFNQNDQLILEITSKEQNKYSYLDNIQIEVGEVSNIYNLVDNSSFNFGINCWNISGSDFQGNELLNPYQFESLNEKEKAITLLGNVEGSVAMTQHFNVTGKKGDIYHISFWYKSEGLTEADGTFGNMVNLQFFNIDPETGQGTRNLPLNPNVNEWQYFSTSIVAENDYSSFSLNFISGMEPNGLSITHIMLNKDLAQLNYDYDSEGNLISYTDLSNENYQYEYDENNQLIASFDRQGRNFSYEYDNIIKDRLLKSISREGISNEIKYNDYGNPTKTIINNINIDGEIKTNHYYHIRLKGTDKYINYDYLNKAMILKNDNCNHTIFKIVKIENDYAIQLQENYLTFDHEIYLATNIEEKSLLCLGKLNNGSYTISLKNEPSRYLTYENETFILKSIDITKPEVKSENNQQFYFEDINTDLFIENKAEYTSDGKYLLKSIDALDKVTLFDIDPNTGLTKSIIDSKNNKTTYTYDSKENITKMKCDQIEVSYEYNQDELLTKISTDNQDYRFTYDEFLNTKEVKVGENLLISNEYLPNNGDISKSTYANGHMIKYDYDEWERIKSKEKDNKKYNYIYDNLGNLSKIISDTEKYQYYYDYAMRICSYQFNDFEIDYQYENNNIISKKFKFLKNNDMTYSYNKDDSIIKINFLSHTLNYKYDYLGRLTNKDVDGNIPIEYEYYTNGKKTSFILKSMKIDDELYEYIYDDSYNIIKILLNNSIINDYTYDIHNELISERNYQTNRKYEYCYDNFGNILNKKTIDLETGNLLKEDTYEYLNNNWKDQLTKFNDISISYDEIGNPTTIGNKNLSWKNGRELKKITDSNLEVTYDYDINGIRTIKNVNGNITNYFTENNHIIYEQKENNMLYYIRDEKNRLLGFKYNEDLYFYKKNNQEDIIGIYDSNYHLIATYVYDSWGKILNIKDSSGNEITDPSHIAIINPFRYRSYYYDEETKLYYLNARYYNPEWGRFLNADSIIYTMNNIGYNLFCYVENNPINNKDPNGNVAIPIIGCVLGLEFPSSKVQITGAAIGINNASNTRRVTPQINRSENKNKLPDDSIPNTTLTAPNGNKRVYGPDGRSVKDIDYSHPWHHPELGNPHIHDWDWSKEIPRQPPRKPYEGELEEKIVISLGVGYLVYRGIRMFGSFIPGFWWTIPINVMTP